MACNDSLAEIVHNAQAVRIPLFCLVTEQQTWYRAALAGPVVSSLKNSYREDVHMHLVNKEYQFCNEESVCSARLPWRRRVRVNAPPRSCEPRHHQCHMQFGKSPHRGDVFNMLFEYQLRAWDL